MSLLLKEQKGCRNPSNDDKADSKKSVAKVLEQVTRLSAKELTKMFGKAERFTSSLGDDFQDAEAECPTHTGNECPSTQETWISEIYFVTTRTTIFATSVTHEAKLKQYFPSLNIPDACKVVMKVYDELVIQDYAALDHEEENSVEQWVGRLVLTEESKLKFSGSWSYRIEPEPEQMITEQTITEQVRIEVNAN